VLVGDDPRAEWFVQEYFGPVLAVHVYEDGAWDQVLDLVDTTAPYALTGAVFADDAHAVAQALDRLRFTAGNAYVNDKPTGAVVGQQPFGGARASGTNDKAGSVLNLLRWTSPRTLKTTFDPPRDHRYPHMG
jgi:1-pyrroline-5-carboxylate dehydrogenase